jgi:hypothetical protein
MALAAHTFPLLSGPDPAGQGSSLPGHGFQNVIHRKDAFQPALCIHHRYTAYTRCALALDDIDQVLVCTGADQWCARPLADRDMLPTARFPGHEIADVGIAQQPDSRADRGNPARSALPHDYTSLRWTSRLRITGTNPVPAAGHPDKTLSSTLAGTV